jgi:uncharacterized membrane protein
VKKLLLFCLSVFLSASLFLPAPASAQTTQSSEFISSFQSDIEIRQNTTLGITETIHYQTSSEKHGIYRYIPFRYARNGVTYTAGITVHSIRDERGNDIPFTETHEDNNLMLKIGDKDVTFTGQKTYVITYEVKNALQQFDDHVELYWDITGEGWQFPIIDSTATVHSQFAQIERIICYTGSVGSDNHECVSRLTSQNEASFLSPNEISYGDNMTIVVGLKKENALLFPSATQRTLETTSLNIILATVFVPLFLMMFWWWTQGRDRLFVHQDVNDFSDRPQMTRPVIGGFWHVPYVYEPLDITPGQAGVMLDEKMDHQDLVAEITDLAHKKYLKIEEIQKKTLFKEADYLFTLLKSADKKLPDHQAYLLEAIFGQQKTKKLSALKGTFYTKIATFKDKLLQSVTDKGLFVEQPEKRRINYFALVIALTVVDFFWASLLSNQFFFGSFLPIGLTIAQGALALWFAYQMPRKTAKGYNYMLQAKGLQKTIRYGKWREEIKEKNLFIEEVLPFAISLGVVAKLAQDMQQLNIKPPAYLAHAYSAGNFANFAHSFSATAASQLAYNPSSSNWSSGSGFSGGSSGGGGGGGGGGSW